MKSVFQKILIALLAILWGVSSVQAQSVNMSRYITLTVKSGENIELDFSGDADGTQVKIVSGTQEQTVTVGTSWLGPQRYTAGAETMTVYGNVSKFNCTAIDLSNNTELESFHCSENALSTLDLSHNSELNSLYCYGNNFTTAALDDIYCSLPSRGGQAIIGLIQPLLNASSPDKDKVLATNGNNAATKNWALTYYENDAEITGFTGTYQCGGGTGIDEAKDSPSLAIYPNPVKDVLNIATDKPVPNIRIYNVYGTEVAHATDTNSINVSHLPAGVYMVRADGKTTRIIKE